MHPALQTAWLLQCTHALQSACLYNAPLCSRDCVAFTRYHCAPDCVALQCTIVLQTVKLIHPAVYTMDMCMAYPCEWTNVCNQLNVICRSDWFFNQALSLIKVSLDLCDWSLKRYMHAPTTIHVIGLWCSFLLMSTLDVTINALYNTQCTMHSEVVVLHIHSLCSGLKWCVYTKSLAIYLMHTATYTPHINSCTTHLVQILSVHILHLGVSGVCTRGWASTVSAFKWNRLWWIIVLVGPVSFLVMWHASVLLPCVTGHSTGHGWWHHCRRRN